MGTIIVCRCGSLAVDVWATTNDSECRIQCARCGHGCVMSGFALGRTTLTPGAKAVALRDLAGCRIAGRHD